MRPTLKAHIANVHPHPFLLTCPGKLGFWPHLCRSRSSNTHSESLAVAVLRRLQKERRGQGQFTGFAHSAECVSMIIMISSFCTSRKSLRRLVPRLPTWEDYRLACGPVNVRIFVHFLSRFIVLGFPVSLAIVEKTFSKCSLDTDWSVTDTSAEICDCFSYLPPSSCFQHTSGLLCLHNMLWTKEMEI